MDKAKKRKSTYAKSGVNIELGDEVSKILYKAAKLSWKNRKGKLGELIVPTDSFSGVRAINVGNLPKGTLMNIGFDGVGTKMELAERMKNFSTIAYDLFAMVCDDAVVRGAEPVLIGTILDVNSLGKNKKNYLEQIKQLAEGYVKAAKEANVAIVNGEVAELGNRVGGYGDFNCNWGASIVWFAKKERLFTGKEIKVGDYLVGFQEKGFRSNGLSLVRKIMEDKHGKDWHKIKLKGWNKSLGELVLKPSKIYSAAVVDMFGGLEGQQKVKLHGVAHITGGGLPGKLGRILEPSSFGANINNLFPIPKLMKYCQEKGNISDEEAFNTWNMGTGMVIITPEPQKVIKIAKKYMIDSQLIGKVTKDKGIRINSNGFFESGDILSF